MCYNISIGLFDTNIQTLKGYTCMISPAIFVGHPTKVARLTAFFSRKKMFFVRLLCWPLASRPAGWHMDSGIKIKHIYIYMSIKTSIINTRIRISNFTQILKLPHVRVEAFTIYKSKAK